VRLPPNELRTSRSIARRFEAQRIAVGARRRSSLRAALPHTEAALVYTPGMIGGGVLFSMLRRASWSERLFARRRKAR